MNLAILCYDFPHWKTQQMLLELYVTGYRPKIAVSFASRELSIPESIVKPKHIGVRHPFEICKAMGIPYCPPAAGQEHSALSQKQIDIGIISGARILKRSVWEACTRGIINIHPGMIPAHRVHDFREVPASFRWDNNSLGRRDLVRNRGQ